MRRSMRMAAAGLAIALAFPAGAPVQADRRAREYKEKFRDGPCLVEREGKADGSYKEHRECRYRPGAPEFEEKFEDGPCKVEREQKADGTYKEKVECAAD